MSRTNSNFIHIWNAFRNLNAIKAGKETTPELTPEPRPVAAPELTPEPQPVGAPVVVGLEVAPVLGASGEVKLGAEGSGFNYGWSWSAAA